MLRQLKARQEQNPVSPPREGLTEQVQALELQLTQEKQSRSELEYELRLEKDKVKHRDGFVQSILGKKVADQEPQERDPKRAKTQEQDARQPSTASTRSESTSSRAADGGQNAQEAAIDLTDDWIFRLTTSVPWTRGWTCLRGG